MKFKKLLAGILGTAMVISTIPQAAMAALPTGYRFYEAFEDATFITQSEISGCTRLWGFAEKSGDNYWHATWTNEKGADGTKGYLRYERNNSTTYNRNGLNFAAYKLYDGSTPFEVGYKFKPETTLTCEYRSVFGVVPAVGDAKGAAPIVKYDTENGFTLDGDAKTSIKNVTGWASVRVVMNPLDSTVTTYMEYNGTEVSKTVDSSSSPHGFWMSLDCAWDNPKDTNKDAILLDDVYAKELPVRVVSFETSGGSSVADIKTLDSSITLPSDPTRAGYVFDGWYRNAALTQKFTGAGVPEEGLTVYAKWLTEYTVTYNTGTTDVTVPDGIAVEGTGTVELPELSELIRTGYQFDGWYFDKDVWEDEFDGTGVESDIEVYAKWLEGIEITFNAPDADDEDGRVFKRYPVTTLKEEEIPTPVRLGYRFDGWYYGDELENEFTSETVVVEPMSIEAKWTKQWAVDFETGAGSKVDRIYTLEDIDVDTIDIPTKLGGGFEGWYVDEELTIPWDGTVAGDMTVYAAWNNIVRKIDFETEEDADLAKTMLLAMAKTTSAYNSFVDGGYGIVDDGTGNMAFKLPFGTNLGTASIPIQNAGEGVYEISFKMTRDYGISWVGNLMSPSENETILVTASDVDGFKIGGTSFMPSGSFEGYREIIYKVDTVNNIVNTKATCYDLNANASTLEVMGVSLASASATGIDALKLSAGILRNTSAYAYIDDIIVRKIEPPKVSEVSFDGKAIDLESDELVRDVSLNSNIKITFSEKMDAKTITSETIYLTDENGETVQSRLSTETVGTKTVATVTPSKSLKNDTVYSLNVDISIDNGEYMIEKPYKIDFITIPTKFQQEVTMTDADGAELTTLDGVKKGEALNVNVKLRNYAGDATEKYFVSVALKNLNNNQLLAYKSATGTITKGGELETVLDAQLTANSNLTENCKVEVFIWDGITTRNSLWETIVLP